MTDADYGLPRAETRRNWAPLRTALVHGVVKSMVSKGPSMNTSDDVRALIRQKSDQPDDPQPPRNRAMRGLTAVLENHHGLPTCRVEPTAGPAVGAPTLVYLHGGGYVAQLNELQWNVIGPLVRKTGASALIPVYELAPHSTAVTTVSVAADVLSDAITAAGPRGVVALDDSAGAGLVLAATLELQNRGTSLPKHLALISPWLDATMTHPDQQRLQEDDFILTVEGLAECGRMYAAGLDVTDWRVSPLLHDLKGLPTTTVVSGTHDILNVDARVARQDSWQDR